MAVTRRELDYARQNFDEVLHTTLNPKGPGAVRIHLIPPKIDGDDIAPSVAIINGQDIIPINRSWAILLSEFIKETNKNEGKELNDDDVQAVLNTVYKNVRKIYPFTKKVTLKKDLFFIMETFSKIAYRKPIDTKIGYMSIGEYAPYMKAPHRMDLMVSAMTKNGCWHCNQKCLHCYAAGQPQAEEKELSTNDWKSILYHCRKAGVTQVTFTGGEPTMREDLPELIKYARWFVSRLNTNGVLLTKEYCEKLKEAELDSVQITFYSYDNDIHNSLVGAKNYVKTVEGIENALAAGLSVSVNTPLCTLNKDYTKTLLYLYSIGVRYVTCSGLIISGNATKDSSKSTQLTKEEITSIYEEAVEFANEHGMEINFTSPGWIDESVFVKHNANVPSCGACLSNMAITPSGNIVPCQSWLSNDILGNMLDNDWEDVWESNRCKEIRTYTSKMLGECPLKDGGIK